MKFEVVETDKDWVLRCEGVEVARFRAQEDALADVADRLRGEADRDLSYSLAMRYQARA